MKLERRAVTPLFQRRASPRHEVSVRGAIIIKLVEASRTAGCIIVDLSIDGAKVELDQDCDLPERVHLYESNCENVYECIIRWRQGRTLGLNFVDIASVSLRRKLIAEVSRGIVESMRGSSDNSATVK